MMKILIAGDFVPRHRVAELFAEKKYAEVLGEIKPIIEQSDFSIVNLEAPVIYDEPTPISKTGPNLSCSENAVEALKWAGFDCVTLANNHFYDQGEQGVEGTLKACEKYAMSYVGGGRNLQEAETVLYKEIEGKTLAIVNCCEHEWSIASDKHGGSNPLNPIKQYYAVQEAKKKADYVVVIVHGGIEMYQYPTPRMQETYRFFIDAGADAVVNHHQHCYSGYEVYNGKPIFYGLGNFCFDKNNGKDGIWNYGYMVELNLDCGQFKIYPYKQCLLNSSIALLDSKNEYAFYQKLNEINNIIINGLVLSKQFEKLVLSIGKSRLLEFEPISNRYFRILQSRSFFPSLLSAKTRLDVFDQIQCDSHREVLLRYMLLNNK